MKNISKCLLCVLVVTITACRKSQVSKSGVGKRLAAAASVTSNERQGAEERKQEAEPRHPAGNVYAMDSDRIGVEQREALHAAVPQDYHIERPLVPRYAVGKDESIAWRREGEFFTRAGTLAKLAVALGVREDEIPKDCYADDLIARSPSGRRLLISGGDTDRAFVFRVMDSAIQPASAQRLRCISFDQDRRWFIQWQGFLTESLVVGTLRDDDEIESAKPREQLYLLDVDTKTLRRIQIPQVVQPAGFDEIQLRGVSSSALLVYAGHLRQEVTIYLNP